MEITTLILTSAVVSAIVSFLLKIIFENKQQQKFNIELAKLKSKLEIKDGVLSSRNQERLLLYPQICEFVYRLRNLSRDIIKGKNTENSRNETHLKVIEFEDIIFKYRIQLENDELFLTVHSYKNIINSFLNLYHKTDNIEKEKLSIQLNDLYSQIDEMYNDIIKLFNERLDVLKE